jgi:hypothetical protein
MRRQTGILLLAAFVATASSSGWAQGPALAVGTRVRVVEREPGTTRVGVYRGLAPGGLTLGIDSTTLTIPRENILRLEQSLGRKPSVPAGIVGFLVGGLAGGALGCLANKDDYGVYCGGQDDTKVIVGAALGGIGGALLGAFLFRTERWHAVEGY